MNVISIDPAKYKTGVFTRLDGKESSLVIENEYKCSQEEALLNLHAAFRGMLENASFHFGLIEEYGFNYKNKKSILPMCEIIGVIKLAFIQAGVSIVGMPVQTWKTLTIGKIDKKKHESEYLAAVKAKYGKEYDNTDEADAFLIYQAAKELCKKTTRLTPAMKRIKAQLQRIIEKNKKGE